MNAMNASPSPTESGQLSLSLLLRFMKSRVRVSSSETRSGPSTAMKHTYSHQHPPQRGAIAALFVILLPVLCPAFFAPLGRASPSIFSEWNAPKPRHLPLLKGALQLESVDVQHSDVWSPLVDQGWKPCNKSADTPVLPRKSQGYIQVFLDGGLNQQRMGICDAVAVAKILNATLVIPHFEVNPVWKDSSSFADIFDVDHFIHILKDEISIVKDLPREYSWSTREYYATAIRATRVKTAPVHASANWYLENVLPILQSYGIAAIAPFSHRLAFDNMPVHIQQLRCKVNFQALVFVPHINALGETLVRRLRSPPSKTEHLANKYLRETTEENVNRGNGKFVVLHLRFDKDMAAHSACDFGGGKAEKRALAKYRQVIWQGRVLNSQFTDEELRNQGRCPLTPEEIGLLLAALGFDNNTRLYLASHKVYGGEARISTLLRLFPLMEDKKSLSSGDERAKIKGKASLLAAVDYYVAMHSDVFISASPGNMHNALVGHRTYENLKTIRPNMALLGQLFLNKSMGWSEFQKAVHEGHKNRQGQIRLKKEKQSIYTYPAPDCMCKV
ncbi:GDP-fucose protein O-fucosyltransferase [Cinnamomum micranthum f. kanehirae]|uniref:O-fucosyltransferase family protein n=1 Tax=Cinnamomum micranthum f. kanehirae TaxID=337451 RepID=A0A3S3LZ78_9MAGN|nr:GDP-fucose protein O-fucosyltransferase [Cinnamomum micranthum f. kanehirae]